jgi:ABC-type multidrug transport system fused ATPase/permease subunit
MHVLCEFKERRLQMEETKSTRLRNTFRLIGAMKPYRVEMTFTIISAFFKHLGVIGAAAVSAYAVALAIEGRLSGHGTVIAAVLAICIALRAIANYGEMFFGHDVAYKVLRDFRIELYSKIETISPAYMVRRHSGQIGATLMGDIELLEWFLAHTFGSFIVGGMVTTLLIIVLALIHPAAALAMLLFSVLIVITPFVFRKKADIQGREVREALASAGTLSIEGIQGLREISMLGDSTRYKEKNRMALRKLYDAQLSFSRRTGTESMLMQFAVGTFVVTMMLLSAFLVRFGNLEFTMYPVVLTISSLIFAPLIDMCGYARNLGNVFAAADRVQRMLDEVPAVSDAGDTELDEGEADVKFEGVRFSYGKELPEVLHGVSFEIKRGETVALVGPSGAGKSTCASLLLRYWDPAEGRVLIGGKDISRVRLQSLRKTVSAVLQDVYLFNISIKDNIRLGKTDATDEEIIEAAKRAYAHEFIMSMPQGYDTVVGERGRMLSGGQKQRIAIARAMLLNPAVLILDEAVSDLDTENEYFINKAFAAGAKDRTTMIIAHRLSTIKSADRVVLIDGGRVIGTGTHEELLNEPFYRNLIQSQL